METAPDGSEVQRLCRANGGSLAQFTFAAGSTSRAVRHRSVEELWYVQSGNGEIWCAAESSPAEFTALDPGASIAIPAGCAFQVRVRTGEPLKVIAVTMPPWPGDDEAEFVEGCWDEDSQTGRTLSGG